MVTIQYLIEKTVATSLSKQAISLMMTNGHICRSIEFIRPIEEDVPAYVQANINTLWDEGQSLEMQLYHAAVQRSLNPVINAAINAIYGVFISVAEPSASSVFAAAESVFSDTPKLQEWNKLNIMLQSMTDAELKRFLALIIVINLSKSARG